MKGAKKEVCSMAGMLQTELKTYEQHRDQLLGTAEGKFVLIQNDQILGAVRSGH
jgi:hypothetical protein